MENKKYIELQYLEGNKPVELTSLQKWMKPHLNSFVIFWWFVFWTVVLILVYKLFKIWREEKKK